MIQLHALDPHRLDFPPVDHALADPDGLLAFGGDLSPERLIRAYRAGIFPWYEADQPILWWSPDPRTVIVPGEVHVSRSMKKLLAKQPFTLTFNRAFDQVMRACAAPRQGARGTWITQEMLSAYNNLHRLGFAHSVEVWQQQQLVGGLYGIALGQVFFGESMFSRVANASKAGFITLAQRLNEQGFKLIDCQVASDHLFTLGAQQVPRKEFVELLGRYIGDIQPVPGEVWTSPLSVE
ncbi:MAG TPA: leucyl/phenylalanyl-tRNA--protein transferase [Cellvibrionaceae bacterium]